MLPVIEKLDKGRAQSSLNDYKKLEVILDLIKDYIKNRNIKQDSSYEDTFGLLALYPFYRERKRYMDLTEILEFKKTFQVVDESNNKSIETESAVSRAQEFD